MHIVKTIVIFSLIALVSTGLINQPERGVSDPLASLEQQVNLTRSATKLDNDQVKTIVKIERIIKRFNKEMPAIDRRTIAAEIYCMSVKYPNLNVDLICATITHESARTWHPEIVSPAGALGLMQIMPSTGKWLAKYEGIEWTNARDVLFDPVYNIRLGTRYLSALVETFELEGGLAAYNGGSWRAKRWLANNKADRLLYRETRLYVPYVLKLYDEFMDM